MYVQLTIEKVNEFSSQSIRMQNGSSIVTLSIVYTIVIGCVSVLTTVWLAYNSFK